jgi:exonuclease SbcD
MRIIHTADWHLGKLFYGVYLTDDQAYVLDKLVQLLEDEKPDVLIVAGDIYDRAAPPPPAVRLLDDILCRTGVRQEFSYVRLSMLSTVLCVVLPTIRMP